MSLNHTYERRWQGDRKMHTIEGHFNHKKKKKNDVWFYVIIAFVFIGVTSVAFFGDKTQLSIVNTVAIDVLIAMAIIKKIKEKYVTK